MIIKKKTASSKSRQDKLQSMFVSIVSHQLRTPLSAVKWLLEELIDNRRGEPVSDFQQRYLEQAYESNERMISLVDDLLNVARLDAGKMRNTILDCDLSSIVQSAIVEIKMFAHAHNVTLRCTFCNQGQVLVRCDGDNIRLVVQNLLSNAVKYSGGKSVVIIDVAQKGKRTIIGVHDQGIGIPMIERRRLFQPFFRASNAQASRAEGSGLGLYIAKKIATLNKGKLWIQSHKKGTSVFFELPAAVERKRRDLVI